MEFEFEKSELQKVERLIGYLKSAGIKSIRRTEIVTSASGHTSTKHKFIILVEEEYEETNNSK